MTTIDFSLSIAQELYNSSEFFPVDFDQAWRWLGYTRKDNAKRLFLSLGFSAGDDFLIKEEVVKRKQGGGSKVEKIFITANCLKEWGMMSGTEKGKEIRKYFLECERIAKAVFQSKPQTQPQLTRSEIIASLVPAAPTIWKSRYSADFWANLERLTTYKQGNIQCAIFINTHIYDYFDEDVKERLEAVNPLVQGRRKNKQHQHFDGELLAALEQHIFTVLQLMQATNSVTDFEKLMIGRFRGSYQLTMF